MKNFKSLFLLLSLTVAGTTVHAGDLTVRIGNVKSPEGQVRVALFNAAADFPRKMLRGEVVDASASPHAVVFKDLPPGRYALSAFHDLNGNSKLDTGSMGRPVEPVGFSRDARSTFGPPSFEDAAFDVAQGESAIEIKLK